MLEVASDGSNGSDLRSCYRNTVDEYSSRSEMLEVAS